MGIFYFILGLAFIGLVYDIIMKMLDAKLKMLETLVNVKKEENEMLTKILEETRKLNKANKS